MSFMPMSMIYLSLIPDGAEGTIFALITTLLNVATEVSLVVTDSIVCSNLFVDSKQELKIGSSGLIRLTWIASSIQLFPILFVFCKLRGIDILPDGRRETRLQYDSRRRCWWGAFIFSVLLVLSFLASVAASIIITSYPSTC
jgi:hypothetical protein